MIKMSGKGNNYGCVTVTTLEETIEILLDHGRFESDCAKSLIERLSSGLIGSNHGNSNHSVNRRKLETLCVVLKIQFNNFHHHKKTSSITFNSDCLVNMCLQMLQNIEDGKDICLPIVYDILFYSLRLLPGNLCKDKVILIMLNSKDQVIELTQLLSSVCVDSQYMSLEVTKLGMNLRVWESILNILLASQNNSSSLDNCSDLFEIFDEKFEELLLKIVNFEHDILSSQALLCIIPKLVTYTKHNNIIKRMWDNIFIQFNTGEYTKHVTSHMYLIMCTCSDLFISCGNCPVYSYPVVENRDFWKILQYGLVSPDALMRKRALYLLKRSVDSCIRFNNDNTSKIVFWWNNQQAHQYEKVWNHLFLILEVLEEKQMHLVEPVQPVLVTLVDACHKSLLHSSWIFCVVQRALGHECTSVVKWGIMCFSELELHKFMTSGLDYVFIFSSLMTALNTASLYGMHSNSSISVPKIVCVLKSFLIAVAENQKGDLCIIFSSLFSSLVRVSWGPVALFYVVYALAAVPKCSVWSVDNVRLLKIFLSDALATQVVHIRGAIQTFFIDTLINLADEKQLDLKTLADVIGSFRRKESLKRGTPTWHDIVTWLKSFVKQDAAVSFAQECFSSVLNGRLECETQSAARMIVLLSDAELIVLNIQNNTSKCSLSSSVYSLVQYFENCHERMYICPIKQNSCLDMLISLLEESQPIEDSDPTGLNVITLIKLVVPGIFYSVKRNMFAARNLECFDMVCLYMRALNLLSEEPKMLSSITKYANIIQDASISIMRAENSTPVSKFFSIKVLAWISDLIKLISVQKTVSLIHNSKILCEKQMSFLDELFQCQTLNQILVKTNHDILLTRDLQMLWGKLVSEHLQTIWFVLHTYLELQKQSVSGIKQDLAHRIWTNAYEALEIGGRGMLIPVMSVVQHVINQFTRPHFNEDLERFMDICWSGIFELRKSDLFWSALEKFVKMTFQECMLKEVHLQKTLLRYAQELFVQGEAVTGICNILLFQLQEIARNGDSAVFEPFVDMLVDAVLFGPVHRRDRKIDDETCAYIRSLEGKCCINEITSLCSDTEVRGRATQLILSFLYRATPSDIKVISKVLHRLLDKDVEVARKKTRYFADSYHHRYRHRIMQVLLLLETSLSEEESDKLLSYIQQSLLNENHQPSIKYLQEWLLVRILLKNGSFRSRIWSMLQLASETRPGSLCSFISIIYHIVCALPRNDDLGNFMGIGMKEIIPYTMAQHFNVRLFAQTAFVKLWEYAQKINLVDITAKYSIVYSSVMKSLSAPCALKNLKKLEEFYFCTFHPLEHFSLQTIFYDLPRLTNITHEEWISHDVLRLCGNENSCIPLLSKNSDLQYENVSSNGKSDSLDCSSVETSNHDVVNIQKKIIPWRAMFPDPETLLSEAVLRRKQSISEDGLIVVASLIDRPPNLGGLSRTCEAFGVFQYVLGNLKYLEDKQFQVLSVTSEQWVSITEVKPNDLSDYLKTMKREGYTVVGAEQTANSQALHEVKFPKRTLLLLGNEKEGIPVNLLPLLDICVEVPQQGVIRSLNVHVTGAIFIWEYARQHNICVSS